ncbi:unnamed protein product, partial [Rangifer tarandus platyrhynchus]
MVWLLRTGITEEQEASSHLANVSSSCRKDTACTGALGTLRLALKPVASSGPEISYPKGLLAAGQKAPPQVSTVRRRRKLQLRGGTGCAPITGQPSFGCWELRHRTVRVPQMTIVSFVCNKEDQSHFLP